jgi:pimeloyl-ACP methyl ester carboxylesterase
MTDTLMVADAGLREFQWESYAEFSKEVRSVAVTAGVAAARQRWLEGELFSLAMAQPQVAARLRQMVEDYSGWHWLNKEPLLAMQPPASERLETIDTPTLVIVGERDIADFQAIAELLCERIPGALKAVIPRVGHMSNMEDPERFNALVLDFMQGHSDWHPGQPVTVSDRR